MTTPSELRGLSEALAALLAFDRDSMPNEWCYKSGNFLRTHGPAISACVNEIRRQLSEGEGVYRELTFDGWAVYSAMDERAKTRTSVENVSDTLDALHRAALSAQHQGERSE